MFPGPTDVITFEHGEIIVSATTAERQARREDETLDRELARYIIHGVLHLNGHLDGGSGRRGQHVAGAGSRVAVFVAEAVAFFNVRASPRRDNPADTPFRGWQGGSDDLRPGRNE